MAPSTISTTRRRTQKTIERLRREDKEEDQEKLRRLEALIKLSEEELGKTDKLEETLDEIDEMDTTEWKPVEDPTGTNPNSSQQTAASSQQGQGQSQDDQPSGSSQTAGSQAQAQQNNAQQGNAQQGNAQQNNAQQNNAQQGTANSQSQGQQNDPQQKSAQKSITPIKKEFQDDSSPLFVPEEDVPEYGAPLLKRPGSSTEGDKTTVGWTGQTGTKYINRYGQKSAARYRLEFFADKSYDERDLPAEDNVSNQDNRLGDKKVGTKWKYTRRHMKSIYGVAWMSAGVDPSQDDLELLNPNASRRRWVRTYILVAWEIPDETGKLFITMKWEPRSALRARWGGKQADQAIYQAACEAEKRYEEGVTGKRSAEDRTPSVGLNDEFTRRMREQSLGAPSTTPMPVGSANEKRSAGVPADLRDIFLQWRADYLMMSDVASFEDLDDQGKRKMLAVWALEKSTLLQAN
ncbi:hypothetical protein E8E12_001078 [Didymella heteroderae]|uniref:Uncharacterized protein n=1 Tax=Didymella heteroderae TaxID=1769908 RepID=A0A9P4WG65_9PLEO|nr:hypothetical protein E8E12_001078 [Didymella heteroderae]